MGLMQARAVAAAKTGIEWGAYQALHGTCTGGTMALTEGALSCFSVVVTCNYAAFTNGSGNNNYHSIQSAASSGTYGRPVTCTARSLRRSPMRRAERGPCVPRLPGADLTISAAAR
jgi:hypothetical protein